MISSTGTRVDVLVLGRQTLPIKESSDICRSWSYPSTVILDCKGASYICCRRWGDETKENVQRAVLAQGYHNVDALGRMNKGKDAGVSIAGLRPRASHRVRVRYNVNTPSNISIE